MNNNDDNLDLERLFGDERMEKGYFEWNRESSNALYINEKENAIDSLETALQFLERKDNLKWKWITFAIHHSLYSFCISALENGNYENVLYKGKEDEWIIKYLNDSHTKKSRIVPFYIKKYKTHAFRIEWDEITSIPNSKSRSKKKISKDNLIGFWTSLARVQDQYFWMGRLGGQKAVQINDEELEQIVWLSEMVRNDLTHFVPKGYAVDIHSIIESSLVILDKIDFLVFQSYSILFVDYEKSIARIKAALTSLREKLINEREKIDNLAREKNHE